VYRTCSIPSGTFLFFPLLNAEFDNLGLGPNCTNGTFSAAQLKTAAATAINDIKSGTMSATIDGAAVSGLADANSTYRAPSPRFSYTLPSDNVGQFFGCSFSTGTTPPPLGATADGIYLMLAPLSPGVHQIHFGGELDYPGGDPVIGGTAFTFIQNANYTVTVKPR
jgi:hypothetical protein